VTRRIHVIGIGAGDPDYVTAEAVRALNDTAVFFAMDKGEAKNDLVALRRQICERFIVRPGYRFVELADPQRAKDANYRQAVAQWHSARAAVWADAIERELAPEGVGAFLAWGDPSLYDSTLAILDDILARGELAFSVEVIPGISSVSTLAARHRVGLNQVGRPIQITTGRRLAKEWPDGVDDVVVMLDAQTAFTEHLDQDADIYWGAYLGTPDEVLVSGVLGDVRDEIVRVRSAARERKGWMFDTYLLRRRS